MKIFNNNLSKSNKTIFFNKNLNDIGTGKYLPSFSKEWKNTVYFFNKNAKVIVILHFKQKSFYLKLKKKSFKIFNINNKFYC